MRVHGWVPPPLHARINAPLPTHALGRTGEPVRRALRECRSFGGVLEPRYIIGAESLDQ